MSGENATESTLRMIVTELWQKQVEAKLQELGINRAELAARAQLPPYAISQVMSEKAHGRASAHVPKISKALEIPIVGVEMDEEWVKLGVDIKELRPDIYARLTSAMRLWVGALRAEREQRRAMIDIISELERK